MVLFVLLVLLALPVVWRAVVRVYYSDRIFEPQEVPGGRVAIVFGAAVRNGRLSAVLRDRMETAINLYESGIVERIIVSGDRRSQFYDEPGTMMAYAIRRGVAARDIEADFAGRRTYDTCYRARHEFQVEAAVLVTQAFHLPRALFTCERLGLSSVGVAADRRSYRGGRWYEFREVAATTVALVDVIRRQKPPVLGSSLPAQ
jgi:SanA protein